MEPVLIACYSLWFNWWEERQLTYIKSEESWNPQQPGRGRELESNLISDLIQLKRVAFKDSAQLFSARRLHRRRRVRAFPLLVGARAVHCWNRTVH